MALGVVADQEGLGLGSGRIQGQVALRSVDVLSGWGMISRYRIVKKIGAGGTEFAQG